MDSGLGEMVFEELADGYRGRFGLDSAIGSSVKLWHEPRADRRPSASSEGA
jgi:hypothetical protein